jgi:UDP-glucose 4-epimerase
MRQHKLRKQIQIAVIGGNGFIGRALIHRLSGYDNLKIFSLDKGDLSIYIDTSKSRAIIEQITVDLSFPGEIEAFIHVHPIDVIIYAAGHEHPTDGLSNSVMDTIKSIEVLQQTLNGLTSIDLEPDEEMPYFLYLSSWSVYGPQDSYPILEGTKEYPGNYSGIIKLLEEDLVRRYCAKANTPCCIVRPTEVYGKHHPKEIGTKFWPGYVTFYTDLIAKKLDIIEVPSPDTKLDLVNINYVTKVLVELIKGKKEGIFNISSGQTITMMELVHKVREAYGEGFQGSIVPSNSLEIENMQVDCTKISELVPYDYTKYNLDSFIKAYLPVRRFEIAKQMAIEEAMKEPVLLDAASFEAMKEHNERKKRRTISYRKIKEIAGRKFFEIKVGNIQSRSQDLLGDEYTKDKIEYEKSSMDETPLLLDEDVQLEEKKKIKKKRYEKVLELKK